MDRLSGTVEVDDSLDAFDDETPRGALPPAFKTVAPNKTAAPAANTTPQRAVQEPARDSGTGQLPVDVHQTPSEIVIRAFVAGVRPDELSISIGRDMVVIEGARMEREQISSRDSFTHELFWGSFSRAVQLPQEIDVDGAAAALLAARRVIIVPGYGLAVARAQYSVAVSVTRVQFF